MRKGKRIAVIILSAAVLAVAVAAVAVPLLVDVDRYRPAVIRELEEATGKPVAIGHLGLSIFPRFAIRVNDLALGNPPGFPKGDFLKARLIAVVVDAGALLHHRIVIERLDVVQPELNLLQDPRGRWNFENSPVPRAQTKDPAGGPASFKLGVISRINLEKLDISAANLLESGRPGPFYFQGRDVSAELEDMDLARFAGSLPAAALDHEDLREEPGLAFAGPPGPASAGQGTLNAASLHFGNLEATSVETKVRLFPKQVYLDSLSFSLYEGRGTGNLEFDFAGRNPRYSAQARIGDVDVAKILETFPTARGKMTGKMGGNIKLEGLVAHSTDPLAGIEGTGDIDVKDGRMPSLQLNKNLMTLARLGSLGAASGDPSSFSSISADLNIANGRIASRKITVLGNGVAADGVGSMSLAGAGSLDYQGVAKLESRQAGVSNLLSAIAGAQESNGQLSFPFIIGGTLDNPAFALKSGGGAARAGGFQQLLTGQTGDANSTQGQTSNPLGSLSGLFKKKKPNP